MGSFSRLLSVPKLQLHVGMTLAEAERLLLIATLNACDGNKRQSAKILGVSLKTIYNKLDAYGIAPSAPIGTLDGRREPDALSTRE